MGPAAVRSRPSVSPRSDISPFAILARSLRYLAPIAVLSAIAMAPIAFVVFGVAVPANAKQASIVLRVAWLCAASGMIALLVLVGALAPILRGERVSQIVALARGARGMMRAIVPAIVVLCAVAMGLVALVVPGLLLYGLFVLAPASEANGVAAKLADSVALVRRRWRTIAIVIAVTVIALAAVVAVQQLLLPIPLGKSPTRAQLVLFPQMVRFTGIAMVGIVPCAAMTLAAIHASVTSNSR